VGRSCSGDSRLDWHRDDVTLLMGSLVVRHCQADLTPELALDLNGCQTASYLGMTVTTSPLGFVMTVTPGAAQEVVPGVFPG
jgi:hypothetical protein